MTKESRSKFRPPKFGQWILERMASCDIQYSALGDFEEIYFSVAKKEGLSGARKWYWTQVIKFILPFLMDSVSWKAGLFGDFIDNAWNGFKTNKAHSFINILSLTIGVFCSLVIMLSAQAEFGHDTSQETTNRIHRLQAENPYDNGMRQISDSKWTIETMKATPGIADFSYSLDMAYLDSHTSSEVGQNIYVPRYEYLSIPMMIIIIVTSFCFIKFTAVRSRRQSRKITPPITAEDWKSQVVRKLFIISLCIIFIVLLFGIILTVLTLFYFNAWVEKNSLPSFSINITLYLGMILIVLCWINFWNLYYFVLPPNKSGGINLPGII